jgi:transposase InsO family protein
MVALGMPLHENAPAFVWAWSKTYQMARRIMLWMERGSRSSTRHPMYQANAICERFLGNVRRELLAHILVLSESHARRLAKEKGLSLNHVRLHQGIEGQIPISPPSALLLPTSDHDR